MNELKTLSLSPLFIDIVGGLAVILVAFVCKRLFLKNKSRISKKESDNVYGWRKEIHVNGNNNFVNAPGDADPIPQKNGVSVIDRDKDRIAHDNKKDLNLLKKIVNILFIDDDVNFEIVKILKHHGWVNTKIKSDISNTDAYQDTHIFFIDINGVGKKMGLKDEGMGLAYALKSKFKNSKVIIYSSDTNRDITNPAFEIVDGVLPKDAQVWQFTDLIEKFAKEIKI